MIRAISRFLVGIFIVLFYRHKTYGKEHLPSGSAIIASNHCSYLDPPIIGVSCHHKIHFLARGSLFKFPLFGWLIRQLHTHPVSAGKGNINTLKKAMELLQSGKKVMIFPEGRRSPTGELQDGQLGVGMLVQRTRCRVVPVYVHGTFNIWNNKMKFPKLWGKTACVFGSPIEYTEIHSEDKKEVQARIVSKIMERIAELRDWYLAGAQGSPP